MVASNLPKTEAGDSPIAFYIEILLLASFFFLVVGGPPPDVNEAHYLTKAKHYWDSSFAPRDFFLNSADAHLAFYWTVGWLTKFCSLTTTAWIGRWISWLLLAGGLISVSRAIGQARGLGIISGVLFYVLQSNLHLAGEWVVGGVEAKGFAFGFCFFAFSFVLRKNWKFVWVSLGLAVAFHVLVGGWITLLVVVYRGWEILRNRSVKKNEVVACGIGLCIGLIGFVPVLGLSAEAGPAVVSRANYISVHVRLSHHLLFSSFQVDRYIKFGSLCVVSLLVWWRAGPKVPSQLLVLLRFAVLSLVLCAMGILLNYGLGSESPLQHSLLRFYWFRTGDVLVPLAAAFAAVAIGNGLGKRSDAMAKALIILTALIVVWPVWDFQRSRYWDPRPRGDVLALPHAKKSEPHRQRGVTIRIERHFLACCQWIRRHTPSDAVVITPVRQQTFKWNALRGEVVTRKDMPQDAAGLVKWYDRQEALYPIRNGRRGLRQLSNQEIASAAVIYDANYLLISQFSEEGLKRFEGDARFVKQFPPAGQYSYYAVYEVIHE
jgi:hypothetical protein